MQGRFKKTFGLLSIAALLAGWSGQATAAGEKVSLGYLYFGTPNAYVKQVSAAADALNRVSPTLFDLTDDGNLKLASDITPLVGEMHKKQIRVVPFISNHWDRTVGRKAMANMDKLTTQIAQAVEQLDLDGVNVDIENLTDEDRDDYTDFVRMLRSKLSPNMELSVAVAANPKGWTKGWQASYDLKQLAMVSDYLLLMAYDESYAGDPTPGPVAGLPWVEQSVQQALKSVPSSKLVLGIPLYGRYWKNDGTVKGNGIFNATVEKLLQRYEITPKYDTTEETPTFTFTVGQTENPPVVAYKALTPGTYTVWYENDRSLKRKLELVNKYNLRGAGAWALSQESPGTWSYYPLWLNGSYYSDTIGHWAESDILSVSAKGWMQGTANSLFAPEKPLTRAQAAAVLVRALGLSQSSTSESINTVSASNGAFRDVPSSYWGRAEIELAWKNGLVKGIGDGKFAPEQPVTREQMAAMLSRAIESVKESSPLQLVSLDPSQTPAAPDFSDVDKARWSWEDISTMQQLGIFEGYKDGTFHPFQTMNRAETAALLSRSAYLFQSGVQTALR